MKKQFIFVEGEDDKSFFKKLFGFEVYNVDGVSNMLTLRNFKRFVIDRISSEWDKNSKIILFCDADESYQKRRRELEEVISQIEEKYRDKTAIYLLPFNKSNENEGGELEDLILKILEEIGYGELKKEAKKFSENVVNCKNQKLSKTIVTFRSMLAATANKDEAVNKVAHAINKKYLLTDQFFNHPLLDDLKNFLKND